MDKGRDFCDQHGDLFKCMHVWSGQRRERRRKGRTYICRKKLLLATPPLTTNVLTPSAFCSKSLNAQPILLAKCSKASLMLSLARSRLSSSPITNASLPFFSQIRFTALSSPENVNSILRLLLPLRVSASGGTRDQPHLVVLRAISWLRVVGAV